MWKNLLRHLLRALGYGAAPVFVLGIAFYLWYLESRPDLELWHEVELEAEFRAEMLDQEVTSLDEYRALEDVLFEQLDRRVYDAVDADAHNEILRYSGGSLTDPRGLMPDWNRSVELPHPEPRVGVLLLHGLSDSPYSMRALAETLAQHGAWVLALRAPGHGTAPAALSEVKWESIAAATRLAASHLAERIGEGVPLFIAGYSNGAALAVHHALIAAEDPALRVPDGLVLLAPALGITRAAALAVWQARIGTLLGLDKVAWNSILPEYDPFKYNSFPVNGGEQMFQLTRVISARINAATIPGGIEGFPRTLVFQSVVDATVIAGAVVDRLLRRLPPEGHELVLFDINRARRLKPFVRGDPGQLREALLRDPSLPFAFTLVTNADEKSRAVVARTIGANGGASVEQHLGLEWPEGIFSLSHVAIPFRPDDPWYGFDAPADTEVALGQLAPRGERGVLIVSGTDAMRLRSNPFYPYLEQRVLAFMNLADEDN